MIKKILLTIVLLYFSKIWANKSPILITESAVTLNFEQTKELYFSFAEGDVIQFDFKMVKGKHLKEIEVVALPNKIIFSEFKANQFSRKINIRNKGIYKFRFYSSSLTKRVGKIKIYRTPINETTKDFNTNWKWKTIRDTIYVPYTIDSITGYNTINYKEKVRELVKTEKIEDLFFNKKQRVHSYYNENRSKTYLRVDLPNPILTEQKEEKVIAWAYWIGVGEEAQKAYKQNAKSIGDIANGIASKYGTPLAGLAVGKVTELLIPKIGEDVSYSFIPNYENATKFINDQSYLQFDQGKGIAAFGKNSNQTQGTFYIGLYNDNQFQGIDVDIKIVAIKEVKTFEFKEYDRQDKKPIIKTLQKTSIRINETKIRVPVE